MGRSSVEHFHSQEPAEEISILRDEHYLHCISLATQSKGNERYGSLIMKGNQVIGKGFNRAIAHPAFRLERIIRQGMANHAEIEAMNDALVNGFDLGDSRIYVAGYFPDLDQLFFKKDYTCMRCLPHMREYGVESISVPTPDGWVVKPLNMAEKEAEKYTGGTHEKRLEVVIGKYSMKEIIHRLLL